MSCIQDQEPWSPSFIEGSKDEVVFQCIHSLQVLWIRERDLIVHVSRFCSLTSVRMKWYSGNNPCKKSCAWQIPAEPTRLPFICCSDVQCRLLGSPLSVLIYLQHLASDTAEERVSMCKCYDGRAGREDSSTSSNQQSPGRGSIHSAEHNNPTLWKSLQTSGVIKDKKGLL